MIKLYFIEEKKALEIMEKYKETEELNEFTINGKNYCILECDSGYDDYKPDMLDSEECFKELREASEENYEVYTE
ncbi:MAG: hypothetical protein WC781_05665 [Candidatus Pacearchaeota archaeon]|jgi:hypothetical protein